MKRKAIIGIGILGIIFSCMVGYSYHVRTEREAALQRAVTAVAGDTVTLNEVVPFAWDAVYSFDPYTSKEEMEEAIGFQSLAIHEGYSEGIMNLVFVKGQQVVASVCRSPWDLGYDISFDGKITFAEKAVFSVSRASAMVRLEKTA